jgi:DNA polymerase V
MTVEFIDSTRQTGKSEVEILHSSFKRVLPLSCALGVKAGFPSPAESYEVEPIDFNRDLIAHPDTTFYARACGDSMTGAGIDNGDLLVVDRSIEPKNGDIVIAFYNQEYTMKYFDNTHLDEGYIELKPANPAYPVFKITDDLTDFRVWGVVIYIIKNRYNTGPRTTRPLP